MVRLLKDAGKKNVFGINLIEDAGIEEIFYRDWNWKQKNRKISYAEKGVSHRKVACVFFCLERKWGVQIAEMIFQTRSRACLKKHFKLFILTKLILRRYK